MANTPIKINPQAFLRTVESQLSPQLRQGLKTIAGKKACFGIKGQGDLAKIMGVLNYGDPGHTFPNTPKGSDTRQDLSGDTNDSAIPPRPWLDNSTRGAYAPKISKYINENIGKVIASIPKRGQSRQRAASQRSMPIDDFIKGLAEVGAQNARTSWNQGHFKENAPATLENKSDPRPLHDSGRMSDDSISAWTE